MSVFTFTSHGYIVDLTDSKWHVHWGSEPTCDKCDEARKQRVPSGTIVEKII